MSARSASAQNPQKSEVKSSASTTLSVGSGNSISGASEQILKNSRIAVKGVNIMNFFIIELYKQ
jgi:hypothetical protein